MTREEFEERYADPFYFRGVWIEDVESLIKDLWRPALLECKTIPEMMKVTRELGCLTWGGTLQSLNKLSNYYVTPIHEMLRNEAEPQDYEMGFIAPILVPRVMLNAFVISKKYGLPEFYAGLQYIRAVNWGRENV